VEGKQAVKASVWTLKRVGSRKRILPPDTTFSGFFVFHCYRGHNPPLENVDSTDSDKRGEWGKRSKQPEQNPVQQWIA